MKELTAPTPRDGDEAGAPRKRYESPRLIEYGTIGKLTRTGGTTQRDLANFKAVKP